MALVLMLSLLAARDGRLAAAVERYESARFTQARDALLELVDDGELSTADRIEARTYLAACYLALKDRGSARLQLRELARQHPEAMPSPASFTPELIALADDVWEEVQKRKPPQTAPSRPPDATSAEPLEPPKPSEPSPSSAPSRALAFIPFGGGHFARGVTGAGAAWFAATLTPFALSVIGFARLEDLKVSGEVGKRGDVPRAHFGEATAWNHIYPVAFFAGVAVLVLNVIVANLTWPGGE
jgi:hypothetical protein